MSGLVQEKAVILLSGGLDSAVTAAIAKANGHDLYLLTIDYGQRHQLEIERARGLGQWLEARDHRIIRLDLRSFGGSALTGSIAVPKHRSNGERGAGIPVTYVPGRNIIFLSLALAYAETLGATMIYFGANVRDYSGYPDCRPEFLRAFSDMARLGTKMGVEGKTVDIRAPLLQMTKAQIITEGMALHLPFELTWSCYDPDPQGKPCGGCDSCVIRSEGFREAGYTDPALLSPA